MSERTFPDAKQHASTWEARFWYAMRWSAVLLIPLVYIHVVLQDILVGVHHIDLDYVELRLATFGWRLYDAALLCFAFGHGMNGLRQVLEDFIHKDRSRSIVRVLLFSFWLGLTILGALPLFFGVRR